MCLSNDDDKRKLGPAALHSCKGRYLDEYYAFSICMTVVTIDVCVLK